MKDTTVAPIFNEIEVISLKDRVITVLKDAIFSGHLNPGDVIVERQIAQQMKIGTPAVREALIVLQEQGFVRRVANTGTYVTKFEAEQVRQLYTLRVELETLAFQWAKSRVGEADLAELDEMVEKLVEAGRAGSRRHFFERDYAFHKRCWELSGNVYLAETLERLMAPLFAFVVLGSGSPLTAAMAEEHHVLVNALRNVPEPEFTIIVRKIFSGFASRWISSFPQEGESPTAQ